MSTVKTYELKSHEITAVQWTGCNLNEIEELLPAYWRLKRGRFFPHNLYLIQSGCNSHNIRVTLDNYVCRRESNDSVFVLSPDKLTREYKEKTR